MNLYLIDWTVVAGILVILMGISLYTSKYTKSVADFLSANRCAGRYVLAVSFEVTQAGAIGILASFEMYYLGGFGAIWWSLMLLPVTIILALSGWILYRFRQTRAMTMAQFFEIRYSKRFRIFAGILAFVSGILNFGIFPAVDARFFVYFCGFPEMVNILGFEVPTFAIIMAIILSIALFITSRGGLITTMVTDFFDGIVCNIVFVIIMVYAFSKFDFSQISIALQSAPANASLINPFKAGEIKDFNMWYFIIFFVRQIYCYMAWQGQQGWNSAALSPHEARMGKILGSWRAMTRVLLYFFLPLCVYVIMTNVNFSAQAAQINSTLDKIENPTIQKQMLVPVASMTFLPAGLLGAFCAMMLVSSISCHDVSLHSWASIFVQDVILPFRKTPLPCDVHIKLLRWTILGVSVFAFTFSLLFPQRQYIFMWFANTGAIYLGGAGAIITGGLYWKRGTTAGAWSATIIGSSLAVAGIAVKQIKPDFFLNGQQVFFVAMIASVLAYIIVSLLGRKQDFNMDKMLHRGIYAVEGTEPAESQTGKEEIKSTIIKRLGITSEFTKGDKVIYFTSIAWTLGWFMVFVIGTIFNLMYDVPDESWLKFWYVYVWVIFISSVIFTVWYCTGGVIDVGRLFKKLTAIKRNDLDDGMVIEKQKLADKEVILENKK